MEFQVRRTSQWSVEEKPCKEAYKKQYVTIDERTTSDPKKIKGWYEVGRNHRVENGRLKRDFDYEGWFVEIKDLDALMKFHKKYGVIVISACSDNRNITTIEIYDD